MEGFVYILRSEKNNSYYIGSCQVVLKRFIEHNRGLVKYTRNLLPWKLVFYKKYPNIREARQIEYKLKQKKSKIIIEQIIKDEDIKMGL